jgi:hypothetical protein
MANEFWMSDRQWAAGSSTSQVEAERPSKSSIGAPMR